MELYYGEKQLILYTKGHFGRTDYEKDLKHFAANLYDFSVQHVEKYNILGMVVRLYQKLIDNGYIHFTLEKFIDENFRRANRERSKYEINHEILLRQMLSEMSLVTVLDDKMNRVLDLGTADEELKELIKLEMENEIKCL